MVSQCGAGAWLNGLASGDQRRLMGSGGASVAFSRQCAIQIDRYFTNLVTFTLLRPTIRSYAIVHGRNLDLELEAFGYYFHPFTVIDNLIYIYIYIKKALTDAKPAAVPVVLLDCVTDYTEYTAC